MPPSFKKPAVKGSPKKTLVKKSGKPPLKQTPKSSLPSPQEKTLPLKTGKQRPVLRMFECLVHIEQADYHLNNVGITTGVDGERMREVRNQALANLEELKTMYKRYWKEIQIASEGGE